MILLAVIVVTADSINNELRVSFGSCQIADCESPARKRDITEQARCRPYRKSLQPNATKAINRVGIHNTSDTGRILAGYHVEFGVTWHLVRAPHNVVQLADGR